MFLLHIIHSPTHDTWFLKFQLPLLPIECPNDNRNESLSIVVGCFYHILMLKVVLNIHCLQLKFGPLGNICTTHGFVFYSWLHPQILVLTF